MATQRAAFITATGGTVTTDGDYKIHTLTSSGDFVITSGSDDVQRLMIGGGGGGGSWRGGGGGAGQYIEGVISGMGVGTYAAVIGAGGAGAVGGNTTNGSNGGDTTFNGTTAIGGGGGGGSAGNSTGNNGGNGGGGGSGASGVAGGTGAHNGGTGLSGNSGAGGAGAGAAGSNAATNVGGNGGNGTASSITGTSVTRAGGGGGATQGAAAATGGTGGGGVGGNFNAGDAPGAGTANTGSGGGAGFLATGGTGGSGVVILRYQYQGTRVPPVPLIIFTGESNSGGEGPNASATTTELSSRSEVQILNTSTMLFENLHIGVNNNLDHAGLNSTTHGIELELANAVAAGRFTQTSLNIVQTGQGGSTIAQWAAGDASGYWTKFLARVNAAKSIYAAAGQTPAFHVFYSQGINDSNAGTDHATWKADTITHLAAIRAELGSSTKIYMTKFREAAYSWINTAIDDIVAGDANTVSISTPDNSGVEWQVDGNHWSYVGYKNICEVFIDAMLAAGGQSSMPVASPVADAYTSPQTVSFSGSGTIKYVTDLTDPHIGTVYTSPISASIPATYRVRAIEQGKKSSDIATTAYSLLVATEFSTSDATAGSITLSNSNLTMVGTLSAVADFWRTVRGIQSRAVGKRYVEFKCDGSGSNPNWMFGLADSGFVSTSFLGSSTYSIGFSATIGTAQFMSAGFSTGSGAGPSGNPVSGDVYGMAVDFSSGQIWIAKNNAWLSSGDPAAGTAPAATFVPVTVGALFPSMATARSTAGTWTIHAQSGNQTYSPPTGFSAWG